jgi:hypothetical protein
MNQTPTLPLLSHQIMFMQADEPTDSENGPVGRHVAEGQSRRDCGAVHQPDADIAAIVAPGNVGVAIVVEVALPTIDQLVGTLLGSTLLCEIDEPFIGHTPTLPLASRQSTLLSAPPLLLCVRDPLHAGSRLGGVRLPIDLGQGSTPSPPRDLPSHRRPRLRTTGRRRAKNEAVPQQIVDSIYGRVEIGCVGGLTLSYRRRSPAAWRATNVG